MCSAQVVPVEQRRVHKPGRADRIHSVVHTLQHYRHTRRDRRRADRQRAVSWGPAAHRSQTAGAVRSAEQPPSSPTVTDAVRRGDHAVTQTDGPTPKHIDHIIGQLFFGV